MHEPLQDSTQAKARELARQITVAHDLDPEIQEELYGHIEDKLLAYMSGDEPVTQEDALILAREHFGNMKALRNLLHDVHVEAVHVGVGRKALAFIFAGGCIGVLGKTALSTLHLGVFFAGHPLNFVTQQLLSLLLAVAMLGALFGVSSRWKRAASAGDVPWYTQWSIARLSTWALVLTMVSLAVPSVHTESGGSAQPYFGIFFFVAFLGVLIAICAVWLSWVADAPRGTTSTFNAGVVWLALLMVASLLPASSVYFGAGAPVAFGVTNLYEGQIGGTTMTGYLTWGGPWRSIFDFGLISGFYGTITLVGCLCYLGWQRVSRRSTVRIKPSGIIF